MGTYFLSGAVPRPRQGRVERRSICYSRSMDPVDKLIRAQGWTTHRARRQKALERYGPNCSRCNDGVSELSFILQSDNPQSGWYSQPNSYRKYLWLARNVFPSGFVLLCPGCHSSTLNPHNLAEQEAAQLRRVEEHAAVVQGYGGECFHCKETDPAKIEVVPELGYTWTGILGRHRPHQRLRRLIAAGFPGGVRLRCPL